MSSQPAVEVRQASIADIDALTILFDAYRMFYRQPSDAAGARSFLVERIQHGQSVLLLAERGGEAVGFTQLYPLFSSVRLVRTFILNDLFVRSSARRSGVATALLRAAHDVARDLGAASLSLSTALDNASAQALYQTLGWLRDEAFISYDRVIEPR